MVNDKIPDEESWGEYWTDIFCNGAHKEFAGKTIKEVLPYFFNAVLMASEDISNMPPIPFQYYVFAFKEFFASEELHSGDVLMNVEASSGASTFLLLVRDKLKESPTVIAPVIDELMTLVEYVATHQAEFHANPDIYGSFEELLLDIKYLNARNTNSLFEEDLAYKDIPSDHYEMVYSKTPAICAWLHLCRDNLKESSKPLGPKLEEFVQTIELVVPKYQARYSNRPDQLKAIEDFLKDIRQLYASKK